MVQKMQKHDKPTLLEVVLRLHGEFRRRLAPLRVTVLQAGVILYLTRHTDPKLTEAAAALRISPPTMTEVIRDLVGRRWVTNRRSTQDRRAVCLRLRRRGQVIAQSIMGQVRQVGPVAPDIDPTIPGVAQLEGNRTNLNEV